MKPGVQACQVAETRRKTHERHCVHRLDVTLDDLLFGEPTVAAIAWRSAPSYCTAMVSVPGLAEAGASSRSLYYLAQMRGGRNSMTKRD